MYFMTWCGNIRLLAFTFSVFKVIRIWHREVVTKIIVTIIYYYFLEITQINAIKTHINEKKTHNAAS